MRISPGRAILPSLLAAVAGLIGFGLTLFAAPPIAVRAWLVAALFFLGLSLGALIVLMIYDFTGGRWGDAIRPQLLAMTGVLPWTLLAMALPIVRSRDILGWTTMRAESLPESARDKLGYFNPIFLGSRTVVIFAIWLVIAWGVTIRAPRSPQSRTWSVAGLILVMVTTMIFATDWMIAPEPKFYSTVYPVLESSGQVVGAFALSMIVLFATGGLERQPSVARNVLLSQDIANLFFGFILLWVYLAFMQWLVIWSGNLPEEIDWYLRRSEGPWLALLLALIVFHFVIPLAALVSRRIKRSPPALAILAMIVLAAHLIDVIWRLGPTMIPTLVAAGAGALAFVAIGGVWLAGFAWLLAGRPFVRHWRNGDVKGGPAPA